MRCACGYLREHHDALGKCPLLRQDTFREPEPAPPVREWHGMMRPLTAAEIDAATAPGIDAADAVRPPQVVARAPQGPAEIAGAGGKKQATKLGRLAVAAGWRVGPFYWRGANGGEGCALRLAGPDNLRAVVLWDRKPGHVGEFTGWTAGPAYVWRPGSGAFPERVRHADIEKLLGT